MARRATGQVTAIGIVWFSAYYRDDDSVQFEVVDTGIGIASEDIKLALATFGQVANSMDRAHDGAGIGLPLSMALVEQHGGTLTIESKLGEGTKVTVALPPSRTIRDFHKDVA